jgi:hypothetical protein
MTARKRKKGESFKQYRENLKAEARWLRGRLRGRMLWPDTRGTYVRAMHGKLHPPRL